MVEHSTADREVTGSIPVAPFRVFYANVVTFFKLHNNFTCFSYGLSYLNLHLWLSVKRPKMPSFRICVSIELQE